MKYAIRNVETWDLYSFTIFDSNFFTPLLTHARKYNYRTEAEDDLFEKGMYLNCEIVMIDEEEE